jgi:predicted transcriptional regulator
MSVLSGCPRCDGAVIPNKDMYGRYNECLMCGYMLDIDTTPIGISITNKPPNYDKKTEELIIKAIEEYEGLHDRHPVGIRALSRQTGLEVSEIRSYLLRTIRDGIVYRSNMSNGTKYGTTEKITNN